MNFKLKYFKNILGALNRFNDIIYSSPHKPSCHSRVLVFFCGDIQVSYHNNEFQKFLI